MTDEINRNTGGKQGGKIFGFLFAKMMDVMAEEMERDESSGVNCGALKIALLEWVDDVTTFAIGSEQQQCTLAQVNEFAVKHKLKWGREKCNVMPVGSGKYVQREWNLGKMKIDTCTEYKYLGDWIMRNGGNKKNIEERENKTMAATRRIIGLCRTDIIKKIQMRALLKLHETCTMAGLLSNCETWTLNQGEREKIQRIELWALKKLMNLPVTTPSPAIWYSTGILMTPILIDKRQLNYLKTLLDRPENDWTKQMLLVLKENEIGWAAQMNKTLERYGLEMNWGKIREMTVISWKAEVTTKTEEKHKEILLQMCHGRNGEKTKTKMIIERLKSDNYSRRPLSSVMNGCILRTRTVVMSMFGMLKCTNNFKSGLGRAECTNCKVIDDEDHRINSCYLYRDLNLYFSPIKYDFQSIFLDDDDAINRTLEVVGHLWNLENGENEMK